MTYLQPLTIFCLFGEEPKRKKKKRLISDANSHVEVDVELMYGRRQLHVRVVNTAIHINIIN